MRQPQPSSIITPSPPICSIPGEKLDRLQQLLELEDGVSAKGTAEAAPTARAGCYCELCSSRRKLHGAGTASALTRSHVSYRPVQVRMADFEFLEPLASGGFSSVFLARKHSTGDVFALKLFNKSRSRESSLSSLAIEGAILSGHLSCYLIRSFYCFSSSEHHVIALEFLPGNPGARSW